MQRDFRSQTNYDPNKIREPRQVGSCLWKPLGIRTEEDDSKIDHQTNMMNQWLKQENIVMMATEDKATLPQNEQTEERDRNSSSEGPRGVEAPSRKVVGRGQMLQKN